MRYFLHLAYNGASFHGWQIQDGQTSVQQVLQEALMHLCREPIVLTGCGRTDRGVHASDFYAHFDYIPLTKKERNYLVGKLNRYFDHNILIYELYPMQDEAHARFNAQGRTYQYHVSQTKQPFKDAFCYYYPWRLDINKMNQAAALLIGRKDFTSFSKLHTQVNNNICTLTDALWEEKDGELVFTIRANRFLRNMVRAVVGTLLAVGRGKITMEEFIQIMECKDRCKAGTSVPAKALFLCMVEYPEELFLKE